jgi:hypothetical protein
VSDQQINGGYGHQPITPAGGNPPQPKEPK